jgi:hypothetical protein
MRCSRIVNEKAFQLINHKKGDIMSLFILIVVGVVVVGAIAFWLIKSGREPEQKTGSCSSCGTNFYPSSTNQGTCVKCESLTCTECLSPPPSTPAIPSSVWSLGSPGEKLCPTCLRNLDPEIHKYNLAVEAAKNIEFFPAAYKGSTGIDRTRQATEIESDWFENYVDADDQLAVASAFLGYDVVVDFRREKDARTVDNYISSVWQAKGTAGFIGGEPDAK